MIHYGYIYLTTNLINNKKYIGSHKTKKIVDKNYIGSGKLLNKAIKKYKKENKPEGYICGNPDTSK